MAATQQPSPVSARRKDFDYAEHLGVIKSIRQQLRDSDARLERSIKRSNSASTKNLRANSFQLDDVSDSMTGRNVFSAAKSADKSGFAFSSFQDTSPPEEKLAAADEMEVDSSFEYLKNIRKTEMFRSDKERIEFLVSEIEILNKRILILQCEIQSMQKENEQLKKQHSARTASKQSELKLEGELGSAKKLIKKLWAELEEERKRRTKAEDSEMQSSNYIRQLEAKALPSDGTTEERKTKEAEGMRRGYEEMKKQSLCVELQNNLLSEKLKMLQAKLEAADAEKLNMQKQIERQAEVISVQTKSLERFKKEVLEKFVYQSLAAAGSASKNI